MELPPTDFESNFDDFAARRKQSRNRRITCLVSFRYEGYFGLQPSHENAEKLETNSHQNSHWLFRRI